MEETCLILFVLLGAFLEGQCQATVDFSSLVDCSDAKSTLALHQKCFDLYDIHVVLPDADTLTNSSISPIDTIQNTMKLQDPHWMDDLCKNIDNYVNAFMCSSKIGRMCLPDIPVVDAIYPPPEVVRKQQEFICANYDNYNISCINDVTSELAECANINVHSVAKDMEHDNFSVIFEKTLCISFELASICAQKYIKQCGQLTLQIYQSSRPDTSFCPQTTDQPATVDHQVDCTDPQDVRNGYLHCLSNNQIMFLVPDQTSSDATSDYIMHAMSLGESKQMCSNLAAYKRAINCTLALQRHCSEDLLKVTVPDSVSVQDGFEKLCHGIDDFDSACVTKNTKNACVTRRRKRSLAEQIILRHLCEDDSLTQKCLVSAIASCEQKTRFLYEDLLKSQSPAKCLTRHNGNHGNHNTPAVPLVG